MNEYSLNWNSVPLCWNCGTPDHLCGSAYLVDYWEGDQEFKTYTYTCSECGENVKVQVRVTAEYRTTQEAGE